MDHPISRSSTSNASRLSGRNAAWTHTAILLGIGVGLAGVERAWGLKLGLPGHFGLAWMGVVMVSRHWSTSPWAATATAFGFLAGNGAFSGLTQHVLTHTPVYVACGIAVDLCWRIAGDRLQRPAVAGLCGGVAFMLKALLMVGIAHALGTRFGAVRHGDLLPIVTHFCFGGTGAVIGTLLWRLSEPARRRAD